MQLIKKNKKDLNNQVNQNLKLREVEEVEEEAEVDLIKECDLVRYI